MIAYSFPSVLLLKSTLNYIKVILITDEEQTFRKHHVLVCVSAEVVTSSSQQMAGCS